MARPKKIKEFEIDFAFPHRDRELMYNKDGTEKYTIAEMLKWVADSCGANDYQKEFATSVSAHYNKNGAITPNQLWTLTNMAAPYSPAWDEVNKDFFVWYDSREDMRKMYEACSSNNWWFYDRQGQHHSREQAETFGWTKRPDSWKMFYNVAYSGEGSRYRELNREVIYDIGEQVVLRTPFKGSYRYDPTYGHGVDAALDRVGMVVEHKEAITRRSRGGKGSRLINVLWLQTGQQKEIPERCIKKYKAPK